MGDKHPLIEFTQGFLDGLDGVDYSRSEDPEEVAREELDRKFNGDSEMSDLERLDRERRERDRRERRSIPDPPSLDDIDLDVGPGRGGGGQQMDETAAVSGSTGDGVDMDFRPEEGVSRADFVDLYERDVINEDARDRWVDYIQPGEYLSRSELRSLANEGDMYDFTRRTCLEVLDGERLGDVPRRPASDYSSPDSGGADLQDLGRDDVLALLEEMVRRGEVSKGEAQRILDQVDDAGGGLGSTGGDDVEMTGKYGSGDDVEMTGKKGSGDDPEVEKLDEMLNRFRD